MKKIFTLLFSMVTVASAFAQFGQNDHRDYGKGNDVAYNDNRYKKDKDDWKDRYNFSKKEMEMQIVQINRKYDRKIDAVKSNWFMPRFKKESVICKLEDQRKDEIKAVYAKFRDKHNRF